MATDYVMTIDSDDETGEPPNDHRKEAANEGLQLNVEFSFDGTGDPYMDLLGGLDNLDDVVKSASKPEPISVDDIIARRKGKRKRSEVETAATDASEGLDGESDSSDDDPSQLDDDSEDETGELDSFHEDDGDDDDSASLDEFQDNPDNSSDQSSGDESEPESQTELDRKAAFFDNEASTSEASSFLSMNLSRPLLKAISALGYNKPTPIQAATIPVALLGKDVVGNAVTGSGKTAAFIIPMIERLLYRDKGRKSAATRCLVLVPTRELGVQCLDVGTKLAAQTDIEFCLLVGGLSVKAQEAALRTKPDIVIATPGRLIDHIRNSPAFTLDALDILVLDEADRMMSDGFADELTEIVKSCPKSRQTMLFSATMTDSVDELVKLSLNKPVRLFVDPKRTTARSLIQEFVRVRAGREAERPAILATLCKRTFKTRTIVFLRSKKLAHQMRIVFGLLDLKCTELHGDLTQEQRLRSLKLFRDGSVDYLMATDLASRGLDIKGVDTVINYDMPNQLAQYLHRVGRTARAGRQGRSVTLVGEADRKMLKAAIKHSAGADQIRHRIVPPEIIAHWADKLEAMKKEVAEIMHEEQEEKQLRRAEMELQKGQNLIEHKDEIYSRPARTWFQTAQEKERSAALGKQQHQSTDTRSTQSPDKPKRDRFSGLSRKAKRKKLAREEDQEIGDQKSMSAAIRSAKKAARPTKIGLPEAKSMKRSASKPLRKKGVRGFDKDLGDRGKASEGIRAKKGDSIGSGKGSKRRKVK
ncbi:hypothetical protein ONZ45_g897 [Pleurotus djamor]|nr:hypothetical protein ONZ45_g897 [Pleurotus djamor]